MLSVKIIISLLILFQFIEYCTLQGILIFIESAGVTCCALTIVGSNCVLLYFWLRNLVGLVDEIFHTRTKLLLCNKSAE